MLKRPTLPRKRVRSDQQTCQQGATLHVEAVFLRMRGSFDCDMRAFLKCCCTVYLLPGVQLRMKAHVVVTSYETALAEATELRRLRWETLVVDEGHRLKNKESRLFQVLCYPHSELIPHVRKADVFARPRRLPTPYSPAASC